MATSAAIMDFRHVRIRALTDRSDHCLDAKRRRSWAVQTPR